MKRLAYEIQKKYRGYYLRVDYCGDGALVAEMERFFRIDERVIKYMTVLLQKDVDMERINAEIEAARKATGDETADETAEKDSEIDVEAASEKGQAQKDDLPLETNDADGGTSGDEVTETQPSETTSEEK
jgi:small subunit ribosomal protein S6